MNKKSTYPSKAQLKEFIETFNGAPSRIEIAKAFHIKNKDRALLYARLKELEAEGKLPKTHKTYSMSTDILPGLLNVVIERVTDDGDLIASPLKAAYKHAKIIIYEKKTDKRKFTPGIGEKFVVRIKKKKKTDAFEGAILKTLPKFEGEKAFGFVRRSKTGYDLLSTNRKINTLIPITLSNRLKIKAGDFVRGQIKGERGRIGRFETEAVLGHESDARIISTIAIHTQGLKDHFSPAAHQLAIQARLPSLKGRIDLRSIPLVTIDGEDARDFDDAVFAEKEEEGWHLIVAIADVAYYVRPGEILDKEALERGNSTYFPDRVLPMLPEELSNGLCSLKPDEDRACLAVHLHIDAKGALKKYKFVRGLMRSRARLTYTQAQKAIEGKKSGLSEEFIKTTLQPLYQAYKCLKIARENRGTLDFERDEASIKFDKHNEPIEVSLKERYETHRLIEEFMITANVAAAQTLEEAKAPCVYRVHEPPNPLKVEDLRESLKGFGFKLAKAQALQPQLFTHILHKAHGTPFEHLVNELVLRAQSRAFYSPKNHGHFGLSLTRYAHFTSPIRRYADLIVHRSLISKLGLGEGGLPSSLSLENLEEMALHISATERNSDRAAWDTIERFMALYLSQDIGKTFIGRIDGISQYGLFVKFEAIGATGFVPMRFLKDDMYKHDPIHHKLVGRYSGNSYVLGDIIEVILTEANPLTGSIILDIPPRINVNKKKRY